MKEQSSATKKGGVEIYQVGTDDTITEATKNLSDRLKSKHGADNVVEDTQNNADTLLACLSLELESMIARPSESCFEVLPSIVA
jgi:hypothetical protein